MQTSLRELFAHQPTLPKPPKVENAVPMLVCTQCKTPFSSKNKKRKRCDKCAEYYRVHWAADSDRQKLLRNTDEHRQKCRERQSSARKRNNAALLQTFGDGVNFKCACGFSSPVKRQFDFHHLDRSIKTVKITRALRNVSFNQSTLVKEGVVMECTNCHRKRHTKDRGSYVRATLESVGVNACQACGLKDGWEVYEFHHLTPSDKKPHVKGRIGSLSEMLECAMVCARCHRAIDDRAFVGPLIPTRDLVGLTCHQKMIKSARTASDTEATPHLFNRPIGDFVLAKERFTKEHRSFIETYEWLGTVGNSPLHTFAARIDGVLAGVAMFGRAYSRSDRDSMVLQRGASASFAHKHLSSKLIGFALRNLKGKTSRVFAYSDPSAGEVGTIYSACNFKFLGWSYGQTHVLVNANRAKPFTLQSLRRTASFKKWYAETYEVKPPVAWFLPNGFKNVKSIPPDTLKQWYAWGNKIASESGKVKIPAKAKWVYYLDGRPNGGSDKGKRPRRGDAAVVQILLSAMKR